MDIKPPRWSVIVDLPSDLRCQVPNCPRKRDGRHRYCNRHKREHAAGKEFSAIPLQKVAPSKDRRCQEIDSATGLPCKRPAHGKDRMCHGHYDRKIGKISSDKPFRYVGNHPKNAHCIYCPNLNVKARGMCVMHYKRFIKKQNLKSPRVRGQEVRTLSRVKVSVSTFKMLQDYAQEQGWKCTEMITASRLLQLWANGTEAIEVSNGIPEKLINQKARILEMLADGCEYSDIAERTGLVISTIKRLVSKYFREENQAATTYRTQDYRLL